MGAKRKAEKRLKAQMRKRPKRYRLRPKKGRVPFV